MSYAYCPHCGVKLPPDVEAVPGPPPALPVQPVIPWTQPGWPTWRPSEVYCATNTVPASQQTVTIDQPQKD